MLNWISRGTFGGTRLSAAPMPPPPLLPIENNYEKPLMPYGENGNNGNGGNGDGKNGNGGNGKMSSWAWVAIALGAMFLLMGRK